MSASPAFARTASTVSRLFPPSSARQPPIPKRGRRKPLNRNPPFPLPPEQLMSASFCGTNLYRNSHHRHPHLSGTGNIPHTSGRIWPYYPACPSSFHGVACCCQHHQASCLHRQKIATLFTLSRRASHQARLFYPPFPPNR